MKLSDLSTVPEQFRTEYFSKEQKQLPNIYEGLIVSQPTEIVIRKIKNLIPKSSVDARKSPLNRAEIIVFGVNKKTKLNVDKFNKMYQLIDNLGWLISWYCINDDCEYHNGNKFDKQQVLNIIESGTLHQAYFQLEAKFDREITDIKYPVYHAAPTEKIKKILKLGLSPRSVSQLFHYSPRIFVATNIDDLEQVLLPQLARVNNVKEWTILSISGIHETSHHKPRWFTDPNYPRGVYTLSNIPPNKLSVVKQIVLK